MIRLSFALWLALAAPAAAETLPALYRVAGVAAGDALNVRAAPSAAAEVLGVIAPDTRGVEVVGLSEDGRWGLVHSGEGNGWVAMRYLEATPPEDPARIPAPLRCLGTEPFWSLTRAPNGGTWSTPGAEETLGFPREYVADRGYSAWGEDSLSGSYQLIVTRETCSDGMSDRIYGFSARVFAVSPGGNRLYSGCCTLDARQ
ncbi:COG3650 family protein [Pseudogemmobacter humi]|uniref:Bacterial SH3 domain protein n=1 Tax=Pseudogemmobacter humi TaxID=2483812 RepID=A0A3P5WYS9_9RHOB|nr:SH3 domain-containing protein [Pseudogemmobacter humi]VDC23486.1 Bacterial SH3 domain protein [Pseudogemmobacter humi]